MQDTHNTGTPMQTVMPGPEHKLLEIFIGKWINEGHTVAPDGMPGVKILTSDVYEWMPGGFFVLHTAYGRIGDLDVGGTEIIGYDAANKKYKSYFFDSQGKATTHEFSIQGDSCTWVGEKTRTKAVFTENGKIQRAFHERLDEHGNWVPSMDVTLIKVQ